MFNWGLFILIVVICIPGILILTPRAIKSMEKSILTKIPQGKKIPSRQTLIVAQSLQTLVLVIAAAAAGTSFSTDTDLHAPFFEALVSGQDAWEPLISQLLPTLALGVGSAMVFVAAYYMLFRPRIDRITVKSAEDMRMELGIVSRLLYGGIVEEVLVRWGIMTLLAWAGSVIFNGSTGAVMWAAIFLSGLIFGVLHIPGYVTAGCRLSTMFLSATIFLNLWGGIVFGWLFWQYGLLSAMLGHALFHVLWYPFDLHYYNRDNNANVA